MLLSLCLHLILSLGMRRNVCYTAINQFQHAAHVRHIEHVEHVEHLRFLEDSEHASPVTDTAVSTRASVDPGYSGNYTCSGLESLWIEAGGNPSAAFMAAEVATAESGGNPNAVSGTDDIGLWQINAPSWGAMATFNPLSNAHSAIAISSDGTNWWPWVTYQQGLEIGRC